LVSLYRSCLRFTGTKKRAGCERG